MTTNTENLFVTWAGTALDQYDHAVTDEVFAAARNGSMPYPEAVCGQTIHPVSCVQPTRYTCKQCVAFLSARAALPDITARLGVPKTRHRKPFTDRRWPFPQLSRSSRVSPQHAR